MNLGVELNLVSLAQSMKGAENEPDSFPGLIFRLKEPKTASLPFRRGKVVITGAKKPADVEAAADQITGQLLLMGLLDKGG